jgi:tRNA threonylcarbamoyladenosine biosynthesis protein TsaB
VLTLALDASAGDATIAVFDGTHLLSATDTPLKDRRADPLLPAVVRALQDAGRAVKDVRRVVCGDGPGGFTALRLAGATAKGIVRGTGAEFWVTPSLALVAAAAEPPLTPGEYLTLLDARREECYAARVIVAADGCITHCDDPRRMTRDAALEYAMIHRLSCIGPDETAPLRPHARGLGRLTWHGGLVRRADPAQWEPDYGRLAEAQVRWEATHQRALQPDAGR